MCGFESHLVYNGAEGKLAEPPPCHGGNSGGSTRRFRTLPCSVKVARESLNLVSLGSSPGRAVLTIREDYRLIK